MTKNLNAPSQPKIGTQANIYMNEMNCPVCKEERRIDRMSLHILKKHKENLFDEKIIAQLNDSIKRNSPYTEVVMKVVGERFKSEKMWLSFGYNCGWASFAALEKARKAGKFTEDITRKHVDTCKLLVEEYKLMNIPIKSDDDTEPVQLDAVRQYQEMITAMKKKDIELQNKCADLIREKLELEEEYDEYRTDNQTFVSQTTHLKRTLMRLFHIKKDDFEYVEEMIREAYREHEDDVDARKEAIDSITL
jgi:hypothetical protein